MSKASFEVAGIRFTDVDVGNNGMLSVKLPTCGEVMAYERGRADGRAEERADIVAWIRERGAECLDENRGAPSLSDIIRHQEFSWAADELEARAKAPEERQDGGGRA